MGGVLKLVAKPI